MPERIFKYFPELDDIRKDKLRYLKPIYDDWNKKINVISRKDMDNFYIHHVLHSLSIAKIISFRPSTRILDVGTGGGFPGIPLAILFPEAEFILLDSVAKKIKVVKSVAENLDLKNVHTLIKRAEDEKGSYDFVVSRAVTEFKSFVKITSKNIAVESRNSLRNGIIYLKGGDISGELAGFSDRVRIWNIKDFFIEEFFETKKIVYLPF
ncbi:MAG: 16S rRNA (guanine(527)-N(7))-methyltransferase RsmG [Bacteroidales bacterium]|nr:16S rRNA (guanine(527)-N(7))-methyltransferase RsmG [Bacteroidales bacterium]